MKPKERDALLSTLKTRFEAHMHRHADVRWPDVLAKLDGDAAALTALHAMETTGGEPDVVSSLDATARRAASLLFCDCSPESPAGRRSACYDAEALASRKENRPDHSAVQKATEMGIELLTEAQYRQLQEIGEFDLKTSSWLLTPTEIRSLGGALFGDRRYNRVFTYHNGAQSYYAARGFRGLLRV